MRLMILGALVPLMACGNIGDDGAGAPASGTGSNRSYQVADFTAVELAGADDVDIRVGGGFSVRAEGDPKTLDLLKIERRGDTLYVGRRNLSGINWSSKSAKIFVTLPRITAASVAGSGDMAVDRVAGGSFKSSTAGSGDLSLGTLAVDGLNVSIAGSGGVSASGTAKRLDVSIAGSGTISAGNLVASAATIQVAGSGDITAKVEGDAKVTLMGSGSIDLGPKARCTTTKMGSGEVRCGG